MSRYIALWLGLAVIMTVTVCAQEDAGEHAATVNMTAQQWTASQVATEILEQTGVQVAVTEWTEGSVTGTLENFAVEDAVRSLGQVTGSSWMRFYMLETSPPDVPWSASELLAKLEESGASWRESLTDQQRLQLRAARAPQGGFPERPGDGADRGGADRPAGGGANLEGPGGAIAPPPAAEGGEERGQRGRPGGMNHEDPVRPLLLSGRSDTITLDLDEASVRDALTEFTLSSRFLVIADAGLTGEVTVQLEDAPLSEALDAIAEAANAQWRVAYVLSTPRQLTPEEIEQRRVQFEDRMETIARERMVEFWAQPPEDRARQIQEGVEIIERITERLRRDATPRQQRRALEMAERAMTRMIGYTAELTPEQRREVKPVLEAVANAMRGD